jgi:hypothetical protein
MSAVVELVYWPGLPGRGEFVRLVLEYLGLPYKDTRDAARVLEIQATGRAFAPPFVLLNGKVYNQTASLASMLWDLNGRTSRGDKYELLQSAMLIMDLVSEVHNVHHPVSTTLFFEDQKEEAIRSSEVFWGQRYRKYCWFKSLLFLTVCFLSCLSESQSFASSSMGSLGTRTFSLETSLRSQICSCFSFWRDFIMRSPAARKRC